jgi:hypothetical protein
MAVEIPSDLHPQCVQLAFLLGRWEGAGVGGYPTIEEFRFGQEVVFTYTPQKPFLEYTSRSWLLDDEGGQVRPLATETGYWRPQENGDVEVLLAHPTGFVEMYVGRVDGPRVEIQTDAIVRTETAKEVTGGHRLYGLVESDLMWAYDMAAVGQPLQPHLSARLKRVA